MARARFWPPMPTAFGYTTWAWMPLVHDGEAPSGSHAPRWTRSIPQTLVSSNGYFLPSHRSPAGGPGRARCPRSSRWPRLSTSVTRGRGPQKPLGARDVNRSWRSVMGVGVDHPHVVDELGHPGPSLPPRRRRGAAPGGAAPSYVSEHSLPGALVPRACPDSPFWRRRRPLPGTIDARTWDVATATRRTSRRRLQRMAATGTFA